MTLRTQWIGQLRFLTLPFLDQWRESELRLSALNEPMVPGGETPLQALTELGLLWVLERLQRLHDTYGRALGIHDAVDPNASEVRVWERALDRFLSGLRFFHLEDAALWGAFHSPYSAALARGRERRRKAAQSRAAAAGASAANDASASAALSPSPDDTAA